MRIATWNLERPFERSRPSHLIAEIRAVTDVDVWVLTETYADLTPSDGFKLVTTESSPAQSEKWLTAIWVRAEMAATAIPTCEDESKRAACVELLHTDVGSLYVYGSVLSWPGDKGNTFKGSLEKQKLDWLRIKTQAAVSQASFCLAGDFNKTLRGLDPYTSDTEALRSALEELDLTCLTEDLAYPVQDIPGETRASIDHICVSNGLAPSAVALIPDNSRNCYFRRPLGSKHPDGKRSWYTSQNGRLSDHHGVVVTLTGETHGQLRESS
jgi:hypothetical protein